MSPTRTSTFAHGARCALLFSLLSATTVNAGLGTMSYVGCFSSSQPLTDQGPYEYQTQGYCQPICVKQGQAVLGLSKGSDCWCGDELPAASSKVDDSNCDSPCNGFDQDMCTCYAPVSRRERTIFLLTMIVQAEATTSGPSTSQALSLLSRTTAAAQVRHPLLAHRDQVPTTRPPQQVRHQLHHPRASRLLPSSRVSDRAPPSLSQRPLRQHRLRRTPPRASLQAAEVDPTWQGSQQASWSV
jgi:hypothetical protein